jgi:hypothetical protein
MDLRRNEHSPEQRRIPGQEGDVLIICYNDLFQIGVMYAVHDRADETRTRLHPPHIRVDIERDLLHVKNSAATHPGGGGEPSTPRWQNAEYASFDTCGGGR